MGRLQDELTRIQPHVAKIHRGLTIERAFGRSPAAVNTRKRLIRTLEAMVDRRLSREQAARDILARVAELIIQLEESRE